jgi:predicted enzyme related to lactoylglutathione lyase
MQRAKSGEFNWVDLWARDFEKQGAFYEALFGWNHTDFPFENGMVYRMFNAGGHAVGGMSQLSADMIAQGLPSAWNTYLATDDVDATVAKAAELGGTVTMPPMDVPGSGRTAVIQDPTGAYVSFWKPLSLDETVEYMQPGTLSWNDLGTRDPQRAIDFYSKLMGWDIQKMEAGPMPYWVVNVDGQGEGGIMPMPDMVPAEVPSYWLVYFGTADLTASVAKAVQLGGSVVSEPMTVPDMVEFAVLADPFGATFALMRPLQNV